MSADSALDETERKCLALHLIPRFGIGGVELAAAAGAKEGQGLIHAHFLSSGEDESEWRLEGSVSHGPRSSPLGLAAALRALREVRRRDPSVVIFSLWRSLTAFLAVRMMYPRKRFVLFLHLTRRLHFADSIATRLMMALSDEVWGDSLPTLQAQNKAGKPSRVVSMLINSKGNHKKVVEAAPKFVSWCRLNRQKRVDRALKLIARLKDEQPQVEYTIIGRDDGCLIELEALSRRSKLTDEVTFVGNQDRDYIVKAADAATFYIQLSDYEGQAMAVAEAMQLGLIPVVTPVGAIPTYCIDGVNSIIVKDLDVAVRQLTSLLRDPVALAAMASAAEDSFSGSHTYTEAFLDAAESLATAGPAN